MSRSSKTIPEQVAIDLLAHYQDGWQSLFQSGEAMQQTVLAEILELSSQSAYAKARGFAGIKTREEFERLVPVSDYMDYQAYVEQNMRADQGQLIDLETDYYLATTGTTGTIKLLAETRVGALARQLTIDIWNMFLAGKIPAFQDPQLKMLAVVNCAPFVNAPNGKRIQRASGQAAKVLWERAAQVYVFPYEFLEAEMSVADRDYLTAVYVLKDSCLSLIFCHNLYYFGHLLDLIEQHAQEMIEDIRQGQLRAALSEQDRQILNTTFSKDEDRAAELQTLLNQYGRLPFEQVWPKLSLIGTWLSGSIGRLAKPVRSRLAKNILYLSEGYGASEAMLTIPMQFDKPYGVLAPYAYYYEFMPIGSNQPLPMAAVQDGAYYQLLITTYSGLFRYNLKDIVRIHGVTGTTANVEFCCKSTDLCAIGEHDIYGYQLMEFIEQMEKELGCSVSYYQGFVEDNSFSITLQFFEQTFDYTACYACLKKQLSAADIPFSKLYVMRSNACKEMFKALMGEERLMQNIKPPFMISGPPAPELVVTVYPD